MGPGPSAGFTVQAKSGSARAGMLHLATGDTATPVFMPVGTQGTVKTVRSSDLTEMGFDLMLANTYHLYLRPGRDVIESAGGLHRFMGWDGGILTDSGGFQLYSLSMLGRSSSEGYSFRSHIDGSAHLLRPEDVIDLQAAFGSDIAMVLDECLEQPSDRDRTLESLELTLDWARRSRSVFKPGSQLLFGIVQGGSFTDLRMRAASELVDIGFDGYAIGGVSVGEGPDEMRRVVGSCVGLLPGESPRYLMGVGRPEDLVDFVGMGVDMFDCVIPTRNARGASFFVPGGCLNIRNSRFRDDHRPVQPGCQCYGCRTYSRAYLRHLFLSREWLAPILATLHNLRYFATLMERIRESILEHRFERWRSSWLDHRREFDPSAY